MMEGSDRRKAIETLRLLSEENYNYIRPADLILKEFGNVLVYLQEKTQEKTEGEA
jgi:hypothetical protein